LGKQLPHGHDTQSTPNFYKAKYVENFFRLKKKDCENFFQIHLLKWLQINKATKQMLASVNINAQRAEGRICCDN